MKNILVFGMLMFTLITTCACRRNENPFYVMSDEQQHVKKVVQEVQSVKQYALEQQINQMNNLEETK